MKISAFEFFRTIFVAMILTWVAVDMIGFVCWALSGQIPTDNFFTGTITWHVLSFWGSPAFWLIYPYVLFTWVLLGPIVCAAYIGRRTKRRFKREGFALRRAMGEMLELNELEQDSQDRKIIALERRVRVLEPKPKFRKLRVKSH